MVCVFVCVCGMCGAKKCATVYLMMNCMVLKKKKRKMKAYLSSLQVVPFDNSDNFSISKPKLSAAQRKGGGTSQAGSFQLGVLVWPPYGRGTPWESPLGFDLRPLHTCL